MKYNEQLPGCLLDIIIKVWVVAVGRLVTQTNCSGGHRCYLASALQGAVQLTQLVRLNYPLTSACGYGYSVFQRNCTTPPTCETKLSLDSYMWQWLLRVPKKLYNTINLQDYSTCGKLTVSSGSIGNAVERRMPGMPLKCYRVQTEDSTLYAQM